MAQMILTRAPDGQPVRLTFSADTEFNVTPGPDGASILSLYQSGAQRIEHVREGLEEIIAARFAGLAEQP